MKSASAGVRTRTLLQSAFRHRSANALTDENASEEKNEITHSDQEKQSDFTKKF